MPAALAGQASPSRVHQDPPHHLRRHCKEMGPVLPAHTFHIHQSQVGFVHQHRGLQRFPLQSLSHVTVRDLVQFGVNQRGQLVEGRLGRAKPGTASSRLEFRTEWCGLTRTIGCVWVFCRTFSRKFASNFDALSSTPLDSSTERTTNIGRKRAAWYNLN